MTILTYISLYYLLALFAYFLGPLSGEIHEMREQLNSEADDAPEVDRQSGEYKIRFAVAEFVIIVVVLTLFPILYAAMYTDPFKREELPFGKRKKGLYYDEMGGMGDINCRKCGHGEEIVSFLHGVEWCNTGYQCKSCGKFHGIERASLGEKAPRCDCGGKLNREKPLFCPACHSRKLTYHMSLIT